MSSLGIPREIRNQTETQSSVNNLIGDIKLRTTEIEKLRVGIPRKEEIKEGNLVLSFVPSEGLYLFAKYNNIVHHIKFTEGGVI